MTRAPNARFIDCQQLTDKENVSWPGGQEWLFPCINSSEQFEIFLCETRDVKTGPKDNSMEIAVVGIYQCCSCCGN